MKTLLLLRHAKSSWDDTSLSDFERPLNSRGIAAARFIGELMYKRGIQPDRIISSPAKRARQTAVLVKEIAGIGVPLEFDERIYEASPMALFHLISEFDDKAGSVMLVGHNPGMEDLIRVLTGRGHAMPTAALAAITLHIGSWADVETDSAEVEFLIRPKDEMNRDTPS